MIQFRPFLRVGLVSALVSTAAATIIFVIWMVAQGLDIPTGWNQDWSVLYLEAVITFSFIFSFAGSLIYYLFKRKNPVRANVNYSFLALFMAVFASVISMAVLRPEYIVISNALHYMVAICSMAVLFRMSRKR